MTVYLVGAGPGDPGLLTVRGAELLAIADVVVHDRLAEASLLDLAPRGAERIDVGKSPGGPVRQDEINALLVARGLAGEVVVRLKGGDPFVFGRGGEEALALLEAGVPFEVVPGVSSAIAAPAYAGVPVTHRGLSTSFTVVTGHSRHDVDTDTDWDALARATGTIVILMGVAHRGAIAQRLMAAGRSPETPVAAVTWGTRADQVTVRTTLADLAETAVEPPATIVVGEVAGLDLGWFDPRQTAPGSHAERGLEGRRVVVTRTRHQASELSAALRDAGAVPVEVPVIEIVPPDDGGAGLAEIAARLPDAAWVLFTSANAVDAFWRYIRDARALGAARVAAVGDATAAALAARGVMADLIPAVADADGLAAELPPPAPGGPQLVLVPQAEAARPVLVDRLAALGWDVMAAVAYRTLPRALDPDELGAVAGADAITFTSSSTVSSFVASAGLDAVPPVVVCIGPLTAASARDAGITVDAVADTPSIDALVAATEAALSARPGHDPADPPAGGA